MFTVILCTYNSVNRISRAIESVLNQRQYGQLVDKFLIIDNHSTDQTSKIIKTYKNKVSNLCYLYEERQGLSYARLLGVRNTNTEWIIFVDDDNLLDENWIVKAHQYILKNKKIGAFNGAVVPLIEFDMNETEKIILEAAFRAFACTHLDKNEIDYRRKKHPEVIPFGAGLVIRSLPLKKLAEEGWLTSTGRSGTNLVSGEDTEMCVQVHNSGYQYGYNPNMVIEHIIPRFRLNIDYLNKLYREFVVGHYTIILKSRIPLLSRMVTLLSCSNRIVTNTMKHKISRDLKAKKMTEIKMIYDKFFVKKIWDEGFF
ncbi:glycosyltransferase [Cohnella endophytica]|uniref:Glycosyltransferase n=1 Tax=Cohnella endophytica TaxID=2419778 RepID=A0A494XUX8_9BACL|nr:glycosyltransferase [Cohnella endophytica]RKP54433.1 glycosyltransferase [Cohnella endophytica]